MLKASLMAFVKISCWKCQIEIENNNKAKRATFEEEGRQCKRLAVKKKGGNSSPDIMI